MAKADSIQLPKVGNLFGGASALLAAAFDVWALQTRPSPFGQLLPKQVGRGRAKMAMNFVRSNGPELPSPRL
jgi:hypothetical protein